jgi:signal peptidase I
MQPPPGPPATGRPGQPPAPRYPDNRVGRPPADPALRRAAPGDDELTRPIPTGSPLASDPAGRRAGPPDRDSTVVIGEPVAPAAPAPDPADDADDPADPDRRSRRERRQHGDTAGNRPAAEFTARADAAAGRRPRSGRRRRPAFWRELPLLVVVALLLTFLIQTFLAKVYVIPSGSMETTLHGCTGCNNDRVLVDKVTYRFGDPQPGDVVVFRGPDSWSSEISVAPPSNPLAAGLQQLGSLVGIAPPDEKDFVKRVIAVGGQTVQCCDSRNRVLVDGEPLDEPYIYYLPEVGSAKQDPFGPITVPAGQLWMMGDSRNNSSDSRVPDHGPVPVANVIGKARAVVLPVDRFGWIAAIDPHGPAAVGMAPGAGTDAPLALGLLAALPLVRRRRPTACRPADDGWDGFLPGHRRWR